ncbi:hypothetical protein [Streptomyces lunaelactis]|nr:hypothetical protein [Streptomyces lunaelactis]
MNRLPDDPAQLGNRWNCAAHVVHPMESHPEDWSTAAAALGYGTT